MPTYTTVEYMDPTDTSAGPSPIIWGPSTFGDTGVGYGFHDDFLSGATVETITTAISTMGRYVFFGSSGATITYDDAAGGGIVLTEATDNESVSMTTEQHPYSITANAGWFGCECRIKTSTITTAEQAFLFGLMDTTALSAPVPITATGTIADVNFVGFHKQEANTTAFDTSYKANGVTAVEVNSDVGTLAVATYIKLGWVFDPTSSVTGTANQIRFYINGALQPAVKTVPDNTGTDFPADIRMGPVLAMALSNTAAETITMDWWRFWQERTT